MVAMAAEAAEAQVVDAGVKLSRTFTGQQSGIHSVAYMPGMRQALSGGADGSIMIWNFKPQLRAYRLRGHTGAVNSLAVAPDESLIASGSADHTVRLWKPSVRGSFKAFRAHAGVVCGVQFSEDGQALLTSSADKMLKLWDMASLAGPRPRLLWTAHGHRNWVRACALSKGSFRACSGGDDKLVNVWDVASGKAVARLEAHLGGVRSVEFDPLSGVCVASAGEAINLWDVRSKHVVQHYALKQPSTIEAARFHPSGNYLLSVSRDAAARIWDLREGRLLYTVTAHSKAVSDCRFSADGAHFLTASEDCTVMAWDSTSLCDDSHAVPLAPRMDEAALEAALERHEAEREALLHKRRPASRPARTKKDHHHHHHHRRRSGTSSRRRSSSSSSSASRRRRRKEEAAQADADAVAEVVAEAEAMAQALADRVELRELEEEAAKAERPRRRKSKHHHHHHHRGRKESKEEEEAAAALALELEQDGRRERPSSRSKSAARRRSSGSHKSRRGSSKSVRALEEEAAELRAAAQAEGGASPASPEREANPAAPGPLGAMTRAAAEASLHRRKSDGVGSSSPPRTRGPQEERQEQQALPPPPPLPPRRVTPPPVPAAAAQAAAKAGSALEDNVLTLVRAMEAIESRLRRNEDLVTAMRHAEGGQATPAQDEARA